MIVCVTGWPTPTVKWYRNGEEIVPATDDDRHVVFTDDRGLHHLVIVNAQPEDEAEYALVAQNPLGEARTDGTLSVIRPRGGDGGDEDRRKGAYPPGFVRQLKNKHVFTKLPTIFDCLVVGEPSPTVEWFHNGRRVKPGPRHRIQTAKGGSHALIILETEEGDAGEYVAVASNCHGTASSSAVLDVTRPLLDDIRFDGTVDVGPLLTEEYGFRPKISMSSLPTPPDRGPFIKEVTGHYLTLSWIPTKRAPPRYPQVTYVIEIRELPHKEWSLLDYNIPEPVCKVRNLELGKSYQFRVRAENIYGISEPSPASPPSRLMAPPQPVLDKNKKIIPLLDPYAEQALDKAYAEQYACAPWFAPGIEEKRYCAEADSISIVLNVQGYPDPQIVWKFRGVDIDVTDPLCRCKIHTYGGSETILTISGFNKSNVGQYQCLATNQYGDAQQNIFVDLATRPEFVQPMSNRTFGAGQPLKLEVRVEGNPAPTVKWMKEWKPVVGSSRVKLGFEEPCTHTLTIAEPMWRDSGVYSCVASNEAGQSTSSGNVTVEEEDPDSTLSLPKFIRDRSTSRARRRAALLEEDEPVEDAPAESTEE
ncbi:unnamed protein product, partial [Mesorhabditis spiculigera]